MSLTHFLGPFFGIIRPCRLHKLQKNVKKNVIEGRHKDWPKIIKSAFETHVFDVAYNIQYTVYSVLNNIRCSHLSFSSTVRKYDPVWL